MFKRSFFWVLYIFSFFASNQLIGQVYIADTLIAEIKKDSNLRFNHTLRVFDFRDENPYFISIYEKKKWLFFPVDQIVFSSQPIASSFESQLNTNKGDSYQLNIYEFYINHSESLFNRTLSLNGSFQLSRIELSGDTSLMGMFYYENSVQNKKKGAVESAYSEVLNSFKTDFISDLSAICSDTVKDLKPGKYHFRQGVGVAPKNFYTSCEAFYGYTFWGIDAEIWFSSAEPSKKFMRKSHIFRYLNYGNRQSVAFSSGASMLNYMS